MAEIILDTNVLSELMRPQPDRAVLAWFAHRAGVLFRVTVITQAEILLGIALLPPGKRRSGLADAASRMFTEDFPEGCLPFDEPCAALYASIVAERRRSGLSTTTEDAQIAAIALRRKMPLATRNSADFLHITGLALCNPWDGKDG